jgi:hypothetical protein
VTADPRGLLLRIVALAALLVGAVVVTAKVDAWWMATIAVAALVIAAGGIGVSVARMLRVSDSVPPGPGARSVVASAVVGVAAVVLAIALASYESAGASPHRRVRRPDRPRLPRGFGPGRQRLRRMRVLDTARPGGHRAHRRRRGDMP